MKARKEIKKELAAQWAEIQEKKERQKAILAEIREADRKTDRAHLFNLLRRCEALQHGIRRAEKIAAVLKHNYRAALVAEVLPEILQTLKDYKGRKLGEKTRENLREELKARTGCFVYVAADEITINDGEPPYFAGERVTIYANTAKGAPFIKDNATTGETLPENCYNYEQIGLYIEDPAAYIERVEALQEAAEAAQKEYNNAAAEYNAKIAPLGGVFREMRHSI